MRYIGIIGSRRRDSRVDRAKVINAFNDLYQSGDMIVSGGCPKGGDRFAEVIAKTDGVPILIFYPNWKKFGRGAAFVRNKSVADMADIMIACVAEDRKGGTEDTIGKFISKQVKKGFADKEIRKEMLFLV